MHICFKILIFLITVLTVNGKFICLLNTTVNLQADKIEFIESPNFPRILTDSERDKCKFEFLKNLSLEEENRRLLLVLTNVFCIDSNYTILDPDCEPLFTVITNMTSYLFELASFPYTAFQGFVLYDDWGVDDCPLGSISRVDPFQFTDKSQILMLRSAYDEYDNRSHPCLWQFKALKGYRLKIVITSLNYEATLTIKNSFETILINKNVILNNPYYIYDKYLTIYLSAPTSISGPFYAYVSLVKDVADDLNELNCTVESYDGNIKVWSNFDIENGYRANSRCIYDCIIRPGTEIVVSKRKEYLEGFVKAYPADQKCVDCINIYLDGTFNSAPIQYIDLSSDDIIVLSSNDFNLERHVLFEFKSDGGWESLGFEIEFVERECSCADPKIVVPCENNLSFNIMNSSDSFYCGNLRCNFTIELENNCSKRYIQIFFNFSINTVSQDADDDNYDVFRVFANNYTVLDINHSNDITVIYFAYISPLTHNVLQAITAPLTLRRGLEITVKTIDLHNSIPDVTLTEETPFYFYDMCGATPPNIFTIQLAPDLIAKNSTIEIYTVTDYIMSVMSFYTTPNLTDIIDTRHCFFFAGEHFCDTFNTKLSMVQALILLECNIILFRATNALSDGCVFKKNVFLVDKHNAITMMTNNITSCTIFLMDTFGAPYIWLSPQSGSMTMFIGTKNEKFFEISPRSASSWHDIQLIASVYTCKISPNSAVVFQWKDFDFRNMRIETFPYQSMIPSPLYGERYDKIIRQDPDSDRGFFMNCFIGNYSTKFTILNYNVTSQIQYYFKNIKTNERINITSNLQTEIFVNTHVGLGFDCFINMTCDGEFLVYVETFDNPESTTTTKRLSSSNGFSSTTALIQTTTEISVASRIIASQRFLYIFTAFHYLFIF